MKTSLDPRHLARISAVKALFSLGFFPTQLTKSLRATEGSVAISSGLPRRPPRRTPRNDETRDKLARLVVPNLKKIDKLISQAAPERTIDKINRIDLAILRLAVWELAVDKKNPAKAVIDEAIEVAKRYGAESTPGFVNGVLGTILNKLEIRNPKSETISKS